nr:MAG TPA: hypothetical protein [Caudoviricetes sp.]
MMCDVLCSFSCFFFLSFDLRGFLLFSSSMLSFSLVFSTFLNL